MLIDYSEKIAIKDLNIFFSLSNFNNSENTKTIAKMNQTHSNKSIFIDRLLGIDLVIFSISPPPVM